MRSLAVEQRLDMSGTSGSLMHGLQRSLGWKWLVVLVIALMVPFAANAQIGGSGTIEGTVTDSNGAVIVGARVTATNVATGVKLTRPANSDGYYVLSPLNPGDYNVTATATGFEKLVREKIHVDGMQVLALNLSLQVGATTVTMTVTDTPPPLETENATLGAVMENKVYEALPLEMGGANGVSTDQRRATDSAILMPGVTNNETKNNESDEPMVVNGNSSSTEMYIEGLPFESAMTAGDPRDIWSAISVEAVDQFQLKTTAYSAEYQGLGVENFTIKSGTNNIHGSLYDVIRNTAFDSAGFVQHLYPTPYVLDPSKSGEAYKPPEHMNEYGMTIGGPIWRNKIFLFGDYMGFRFSALTKPQSQTIPTAAALCGDFSAFTTAPIYDPTTQALTGGSYARTQFAGGPTYAYDYATKTCVATGNTATANVIPQNEISPIAQYLQQWMPQPTSSGLTNNYTGAYTWGLNNWSTTERLDAVVSPKDNLSVIIAAGRQGLVGSAGSQTTNVSPLPYEYAKTYAPITRVAIFQDTYLINQNLVDQFSYGAAQYHSPDQNPTYGSAIWAASASGITGLPSSGQASGGFPDVVFSGTDDPAKWGPQDGYVQNVDTYSMKDNLQWLHGKHSFTFGGQYEWLGFNDLYADGGTTPTTLNLGVNETAQVSGSSAAIKPNTGLAYASYLMGAVDSGNYTEYASVAKETGARYHPFAFYANDDWKATDKLTVNLGLRWDSMPPMREAENRISFLNPTATNSVTGTPGTLEFGGKGTNGCNCTSPMKTYYKDWGPRLGMAYALNNKTVLRAAYGIYYAHGGGTSGGQTSLPSSNMELGFSAAPNTTSAGYALPAFYLNNSSYFTTGTNGSVANTVFGGPGFAATVTAPPIYDATYGTYYTNATGFGAPDKISSKIAYLDPKYGGRTPTFEGWSIGFQRLLTKDITATLSYVGNEGHFLQPTGNPRGYWSNQLDPQYLNLGSSVLGSKTASSMPGGAFTYASYDNTVAQDLTAFPQYNGVVDQVASVGNSNYNALQLSIVQRLAHGLTFMVNYTYSKTIDDTGTFRTGYAIPAGVLANSGKAMPLDRIDRSLSVQDQPQNLVATSTYDLPFGRGHIGAGNAIVRNLVGGWSLADIFSYVSGNPLAITEGSCTATGQGTCMPSYNKAFTGSARQNGKWGSGASGNPNAANYLSKIQYINPSAFSTTSTLVNPNCTAGTTACTGMVIGDVARTAPYGLRGPSNYNIDATLRRTFDLWKNGRAKFVFDASAFNVFNHVWFGSPASTADGSIGSATGSSSLGVVAGQANSPRQFQFAGHINF